MNLLPIQGQVAPRTHRGTGASDGPTVTEPRVPVQVPCAKAHHRQLWLARWGHYSRHRGDLGAGGLGRRMPGRNRSGSGALVGGRRVASLTGVLRSAGVGAPRLVSPHGLRCPCPRLGPGRPVPGRLSRPGCPTPRLGPGAAGRSPASTSSAASSRRPGSGPGSESAPRRPRRGGPRTRESEGALAASGGRAPGDAERSAGLTPPRVFRAALNDQPSRRSARAQKRDLRRLAAAPFCACADRFLAGRWPRQQEELASGRAGLAGIRGFASCCAPVRLPQGL